LTAACPDRSSRPCGCSSRSIAKTTARADKRRLACVQGVKQIELFVDTVIEDARWDELGLAALADRAVLAVLINLGLPHLGLSLCLLGCDDARIAALNADFRGKPTPTNVLSWPDEDLSPDIEGDLPLLPVPGTAEDPQSLGNIAIAYETCTHEAVAEGKPVADHVTHLIVHGMLHVLGYDHQRDADAARMEATEVAILASLGIPDPY